jgi:hypothetical protein
MPYSDEIRQQGTIYSGKSCLFDFGFDYVEGVMKAGVGAKRERKLVPGSRRDGKPIGLTAGKFTPGTFKFALLSTTASMLNEFLASPSLGSITDTIFNPTVQLYEPDKLADVPITVTITNAVITSWDENYDEGIDETVTEYEAMFTDCSRNGFVLWSILRNV